MQGLAAFSIFTLPAWFLIANILLDDGTLFQKIVLSLSASWLMLVSKGLDYQIETVGIEYGEEE